MIQPSAPSVSTTLALGPGAPAQPGDEAAVSVGFAALLETTTAAGKAQQADVSEGPAPAIPAASFVPPRQAGGKLAGKKLPGEAPDLRTALKEATKSDDSDVYEPLSDAPPAPEGLTASPDIILPGLIVPGSVPDAPQTPQAPAPAPTERSTAKTLLKTSAAVLPLPSAPPVQTQPTQPQAAQPQTTPPQARPMQATQLLATPLPARASTTATRGEIAAAPVQATPIAPEPRLAAAPAPASDISLPVALEPAAAQAPAATPPAPSAEAISVMTRLALPAASPPSHLPVADKTAAAPRPAPGEVPPAPISGDSVQVTIPRVAAAAAQPTATVLQASGRTAAPARTPARPATQSESAPVKPVAAKAEDRPAATPAPDATVQADAPKARPAIAAQGAGADSRKREPAEPARQEPALAIAQPVPDPQTIAPAAEPKSAAEGIQSGHDFATLVDRLVEAREAASPDSVRAAISHSEFGQVSLRFDQDANGLSVSMTSADPDFAGAVQASAASAQAQTQADSGSNQRQDSQSQQHQQTQAQAGGQGFAQAQSQFSARDERAHQSPQQTPAAEARFGRPASQQRQDDGSAASRGGIYA